MVVRGAREQKWNRSTSNNGSLKLLRMQRYEDMDFGIYGSI